MPQMDYITKGDVIYMNQPKVYFCCHEDDMKRYLQVIAKELWNVSECAVFYDSDSHVLEDESEWQEMLLDVNLFVVMVTRKFLETENQAQKDFLFVREKNIPILPLVDGNTFLTAFNKRFGGLQALNIRKSTDKTEIPYKEKLERYLQSVLVDSELIRRIQEESEDFIFLSYRKKDRKYLLELIRQLREDEACQDIAIWYDEFLVFGEEFGEQIAKKICDGKVFMLNVTPNLVNEENYVQKEEYPLAARKNKTIIAIEMVETERAMLEEQYKEIPECISKDDKTMFVEAVRNALADRKDSQNETAIKSPEHTYVIGIDFFTGTNREKNLALGLKKIIESASEGYEEAIRKLVSIYELGEGIEANLLEAIKWQQQLIAQTEGAEDKAWEYIALGDLYKKNLQLKEAQDAYDYAWMNAEKPHTRLLAKDKRSELEGDQSINISEQCSQDEIKVLYRSYCRMLEESEEVKEKFIKYCIFGTEQKKRGAFEEAIAAYKDVFHKCCIFAETLEQRDALKEAREAYEEALKVLNGLRKYVDKDIYYDNRLTLSHHIANLSLYLCEYTNAEKQYIDIVELCEELYRTEDELEVLSQLSIAYENLAKFYLECENDEAGYRKALRYINKSIKYSERQLDENQSGAMEALRATYRVKSGICLALKQYEDAMKACEKSIGYGQILRNLSVSDELELAHIYDDKGDIYNEQLRQEEIVDEDARNSLIREAIEAYEKGLEIRETLNSDKNLSEDEYAEIVQALTFSYDNLILLSYSFTNNEEKKKCLLYYLGKNIKCSEAMYQLRKDRRSVIRDLFVAYRRVVEAHWQCPEAVDAKMALEYKNKALNLAEDTGLSAEARTAREIKNIKEVFGGMY